MSLIPTNRPDKTKVGIVTLQLDVTIEKATEPGSSYWVASADKLGLGALGQNAEEALSNFKRNLEERMSVKSWEVDLDA